MGGKWGGMNVWDLTYYFTSRQVRLVFDRTGIALQLLRVKEVLQTSNGDRCLDHVRNLRAS